ncbi:MAG: bifunctional 4-hydroxy-2-oxoglutarate aldolase/2-dehydro-3-deoxy-phosphogluconate aldolase [Alistipes sp.]|jgi:2-dehydro-3-deoxyphosphogluconate aldolase/(4S)-4-hydroxy-2-oxoglutarate aldolase|nr:bifunctional 4-hydroxy-2-oxoglutarate aldolase/2-dehydro-3-deoxy-phosphogluconate aldolase [Alistipes sp.]
MNVLEIMERTGVVPVFYNGDAAVAANVVKACYRGGIRTFEFTNRGEKAFEVFSALVRMAAGECPGLVMGIGSIVSAADCRRFVEAGARFVVGPVFSAEVMAEAALLGVPYIPGAATPTEVFNAWKAGAKIVKVFPAAEVGGPSFVKAVLAPMPWLRIMVTGGVEPTRENLSKWFAAGVRCVGIGSNLFPGELVDAGRWDEMADDIARTLAVVAELKA